ncbi:hypothetical protein M427DRAFT_42393 [Gonapodya prolifera JEL478]|uniref:Uncharacterized protein n=1 Tax=Gonapodya prolifera (strain JEL478) TaxID=1344416 RepID=A0A139AQH9_GONPJ|nr:hypothetical protein M427DRAFT_42393 [Gonapodya prolifera JEL478]|eukprot:KXS18745.1 hypothetical protein M427DRAFT_42393 [Gonapodya prolifera JEL478]
MWSSSFSRAIDSMSWAATTASKETIQKRDSEQSDEKSSCSPEFYLKDGDLVIDLPRASGTVQFRRTGKLGKDAKGAADLRILCDKLIEEAANQAIVRARRYHDGDFRCELSPFTEGTQKQLIQAISLSRSETKLTGKQKQLNPTQAISSSRGDANLAEIRELISKVIPLLSQKSQNVAFPVCGVSVYNGNTEIVRSYQGDRRLMTFPGHSHTTIAEHFIQCMETDGLLQ